jgi:protein SCO1/2
MLKKVFLAAVIIGMGLFISVGCKPPTAAAGTQPSATNSYAVRGVVQEIQPDHRTATIKHEKIPGYMAAMTMDFSVRDTNVLNGISAGDEITFNLVVTENDDWVENIAIVGKTKVAVIPTWRVVESELKVGDVLPDFEFTGEDGKTFRFADFRGSAVAFTFFFTSCPLPEFCPRMNKNFAEARKLISAATNAPSNWQLLSISFDPGFDTPEMISGYAKFYRGDRADHWRFAVASTNTLAGLAPKVDLNFWRENGSISHNLRTVVLDAAGKIFRQFDGNDWTPEQLATAVIEAARPK